MDEPGRNYPLFFHDEAVALAAGHRPCGECRPEALAVFIDAWKIGQGMEARDWVPLREIDRQLHQSRLAEMRRRRRVDASSLPDGVFVWCPTANMHPMIVVGDHLRAWSHEGYANPIGQHELTGPIYCLTPSPIVATICGGYKPSYSENCNALQN